jgi:hypothetical protein
MKPQFRITRTLSPQAQEHNRMVQEREQKAKRNPEDTEVAAALITLQIIKRDTQVASYGYPLSSFHIDTKSYSAFNLGALAAVLSEKGSQAYITLNKIALLHQMHPDTATALQEFLPSSPMRSQTQITLPIHNNIVQIDIEALEATHTEQDIKSSRKPHNDPPPGSADSSSVSSSSSGSGSRADAPVPSLEQQIVFSSWLTKAFFTNKYTFAGTACVIATTAAVYYRDALVRFKNRLNKDSASERSSTSAHTAKS